LELQLEELEAAAREDEIAAETAAARTTSVTAFERTRPSRQPFPEHLPRERIVEAAPCVCPRCGGARLSKLGEDVTAPAEGDAVSQAPAPFRVTRRGRAGPNLLAMLLFERFGQPQPLNRYMLRRWPSCTRFLTDGRICLTNNAAERALRGVALRRKAWLFCGSDRGGQRAAVPCGLIDPPSGGDVLGRGRRPPVPGQQLVDLLGGMGGQPGPHVGEPGLWVDVVHPGLRRRAQAEVPARHPPHRVQRPCRYSGRRPMLLVAHHTTPRRYSQKCLVSVAPTSLSSP
jgi:hypothetical protein